MKGDAFGLVLSLIELQAMPRNGGLASKVHLLVYRHPVEQIWGDQMPIM